MATPRQKWAELERELAPDTPELLLLSTHTVEPLVALVGLELIARDEPRRVSASSYVAATSALAELSARSTPLADVAILTDFEGIFGHSPEAGRFERDLEQWLDGVRRLAAAGTRVWAFLLPPLRDSAPADVLASGRLPFWYRANAALLEAAADTTRLQAIDLPGLLAHHDRAASDDRLWYFALQPYSTDFLASLAGALARAVTSATRVPYKALVLDCDGVLWGGVLGEDGPDGIKLGDTDPVGRAFGAVQRQLSRLAARGVLLALCSKNEPADVWDVIDSHPGMVLGREQFAAAEINWRPKSENILAIAKKLNILPEAIVFLDDNPAEVSEVGGRLPECRSVLAPRDPAVLPGFLAAQDWFDAAEVTAEDLARSTMLAAERHREARSAELTAEDYLADLELRVEVGSVEERNMRRVVQLLGKTNQFNVSVRRHDEAALRSLLDRSGWFGLTVTVSDRFGGYGLTGVTVAGPENESLVVDTFLLSCRVLGRNVEDLMLALLTERADALGLRTLRVHTAVTERNQPARAFLDRIGFAPQGGPVREIDVSQREVVWPRHIIVERAEAAVQ